MRYRLVSTSLNSSGGGNTEVDGDGVPSASASGTGASWGSHRISSPPGRLDDASDSFTPGGLPLLGLSASSGGSAGSGDEPDASWEVSLDSESCSSVAEVTEDEERFEVRGAVARAGSLRGYRTARVEDIRARCVIDGCLNNDRVLRNTSWHRIQGMGAAVENSDGSVRVSETEAGRLFTKRREEGRQAPKCDYRGLSTEFRGEGNYAFTLQTAQHVEYE